MQGVPKVWTGPLQLAQRCRTGVGRQIGGKSNENQAGGLSAVRRQEGFMFHPSRCRHLLTLRPSPTAAGPIKPTPGHCCCWWCRRRFVAAALVPYSFLTHARPRALLHPLTWSGSGETASRPFVARMHPHGPHMLLQLPPTASSLDFRALLRSPPAIRKRVGNLVHCNCATV